MHSNMSVTVADENSSFGSEPQTDCLPPAGIVAPSRSSCTRRAIACRFTVRSAAAARNEWTGRFFAAPQWGSTGVRAM
jgi:hypothetical protein